MERGYAIDLICCSLEETGLHEMRPCVQCSGGVALQAETFGALHLRQSLCRFFAQDAAPLTAVNDDRHSCSLSLGYRCSLELRTSKECASATLLGGGSDIKTGGMATVSETGNVRTFSWSIGAVDSHFTAGVELSRGGENTGLADANLMQLCATYRHASGATRVRVSTLRVPRLHQKTPTHQLLPAFDQLAAAAMAVRIAVHQAEEGGGTSEMLKSIDRRLITTMRSLCHYTKGDPASVVLPPQASQLPGLVFHLRRSPAVRTSGLSPDETAYFRQLVCSLSVVATLVLVQPTLTGYTLGRGFGQPLQLGPLAMAPDRSLLLDTYLKLILCHGAHVAEQRRVCGSTASNALRQLETASEADLERLADSRFPAPETFVCDQYSSKARYVVQKLNPDVPFMAFLQGLYKAIVS